MLAATVLVLSKEQIALRIKRVLTHIIVIISLFLSHWWHVKAGRLKKMAWGHIPKVLLVLYIWTLVANVYYLWKSPTCRDPRLCILPVSDPSQLLDISIYTSEHSNRKAIRHATLLHQTTAWPFSADSFNVTLPVPLKGTSVRNNGSLFAHIIVAPHDPDQKQLSSDEQKQLGYSGSEAKKAKKGADFPPIHLVTPLVKHTPVRFKPRQMLINSLTANRSTAEAEEDPVKQITAKEAVLEIESSDKDKKGMAEDNVVLELVTALFGAALILSASHFLHHPRLGGVSYVVLALTTVAIFIHSTVLRNRGDMIKKNAPSLLATDKGPPVAHWIPNLKIHVVDDFSEIPTDSQRDLLQLMRKHAQIVGKNKYSPVAYVDTFSLVTRSFRPLGNNHSAPDPDLMISIDPVSLFFFRGYGQVVESMSHINQYGMNEHDLDDLKTFFSKQRLHVLVLTYVISVLHMIFDFLAFKNDVGFYRKKRSFAGLSSRSIISSFICSLIIYLYLVDSEHVSTMVLGSVGVSTLIELWKIKRVLKIEFVWENGWPWVTSVSHKDHQSAAEKDTLDFDKKAMQYLSMVMYPLVFSSSVYSLIYYPQKSWWGWVIGSLAHGVYTFGFVMMTPQLFINYRMKSVAHLPWRVFMYKAFNTFIDDVFSFIVQMPMAHRVACLRDDVVFFVYLYQRYLYPVDKKRANEYGFSYEDEEDENMNENSENKIENKDEGIEAIMKELRNNEQETDSDEDANKTNEKEIANNEQETKNELDAIQTKENIEIATGAKDSDEKKRASPGDLGTEEVNEKLGGSVEPSASSSSSPLEETQQKPMDSTPEGLRRRVKGATMSTTG